MLRSMFSGISGLRSHQTMMDVVGNNIANVNTTGFKSSQTLFQDTLSQMLQSTTVPQAGLGGTNAAQVGLGSRVAAIGTNFGQGSAQSTGRAGDLMIEGDGFFVVSTGTASAYTRAGSFTFDSEGRLVTPQGQMVLGWQATDGVVDPNSPIGELKLPTGVLFPPKATTEAAFTGNLPADQATATPIVSTLTVYDAQGNERKLQAGFTRTSATSWDVTLSDGTATSGPTALTFDADGSNPTPTTLSLGAVTIDLTKMTGFAGTTSVVGASQNGSAVGTLQGYSLGADGVLSGSFSNGLRMTIGQLALATFNNPNGLEKAGGSTYTATGNSGVPQIGTAGTGGRGSLAGGTLEMSNVDLANEFTNLIIAQRGFQANSRVISASDEILQDLVNLKR